MNLDLLFKKAKELNIDNLEATIVKSVGEGIKLYEGEVESFNIGEVQGIGLRGTFNNKDANVYSELLDDSEIEFLLSNLIETAKLQQKESSIDLTPPPKQQPKTLRKIDESLRTYDTKSKISLIKELSKLLEKSNVIKKVTGVSISYSEGNSIIKNSKGLELHSEGNGLNVSCEVTFDDDGKPKSYYDSLWIKDVKKIDLEKFVNKVTKEVASRIGSVIPKSGTYPVILRNDIAADFIYSFSGAFDSDDVRNGISLLKDKVGQKIASEKLTIQDLPLDTRFPFISTFDSEGVLTQNMNIVDKGVLTTFLYNKQEAKLAGKESTGHGSKGGFKGKVGVGFNNFVIKPGTKSFNDIVKSLDKAIIITDLEGMHSGINSMTGDYSLKASGLLIENGKITKPLDLFTVAGNYFEMIKEIEEVASDLEIEYSSIHSPSILFKKLSISGE